MEATSRIDAVLAELKLPPGAKVPSGLHIYNQVARELWEELKKQPDSEHFKDVMFYWENGHKRGEAAPMEALPTPADYQM
jgi:hypothetical protein